MPLNSRRMKGACSEQNSSRASSRRNTVSLSELDEPLINWWSISEHAYIAGLFSEGASGGYSCGRLGV